MSGKRRLCFALDLKDDHALIARYKEWHRPGGPPQAVNDSIRSAGIEQMEIYLCGNRLFMVMQVNDSFSAANKAAADGADPAVQAWEARMNEFQQPLPWAAKGEKWVASELVYSLADQP